MTFVFEKRPGAIIVAPAWGTSGSFEVFKAQCRVLRDLGYAVCFVAVPQYWYDRDGFYEYINGYKRCWDQLDVDTRCIAGYPKWLAALKSSKFDRNTDNRSASIKDSKGPRLLDVPNKAVWFALTHRRLFVVCNHCFNVPFVERLTRRVARKLRFVLETHDIQSYQSMLRNADLDASGFEDSVRDEISFCRKASELVNISTTDHAFFKQKIPEVPSQIIYPYLPFEHGAAPRPAEISFLIVASWNHPNAMSLDWFLREVWAKYDGGGTLKILGNVDEAMQELYPDTYEKWRHVFAGKVQNISSYYNSSAIVLVPTIAGGGIAIKFAEAMAFQKRVLFSPLAVRGLPEAVVQALAPSCCRTAEEFLAKLMTAERIDTVERDETSRSIYEQLFDWSRYRKLYGELAARNET